MNPSKSRFERFAQKLAFLKLYVFCLLSVSLLCWICDIPISKWQPLFLSAMVNFACAYRSDKVPSICLCFVHSAQSYLGLAYIGGRYIMPDDTLSTTLINIFCWGWLWVMGSFTLAVAVFLLGGSLTGYKEYGEAIDD